MGLWPDKKEKQRKSQDEHAISISIVLPLASIHLHRDVVDVSSPTAP